MPKGALKGHIVTQETRLKLSLAAKGRKHSASTRTKMRLTASRLRNQKKQSSLRKTPYSKEEIDAYIFRFIQDQSLRRGEELSLSKEEVLDLVYAPCHYCGALPRLHKMRGKSRNQDVSYYRNGIDRKDSSLGYVKGNVLPCCAICNRAKGAMSYLLFLEWVDTVFNNTREMEKELNARNQEVSS